MTRTAVTVGSPSVLSRFLTALVLLFLFAPIVIAVMVAFSSGDRLEFPLPGLSLHWFGVALSNRLYMEGVWVSTIIAVGNAVIATVVGTCAALALNRYRFYGRALIQAIVMLPIAMPAIVLGLGLLFTLASYDMRPGIVAAMIGHSVLGVPYVVAMVSAALANYDTSLERASMNLGVSPTRTFFLITLPMIRGGVIAGGITAFLISFDNFSLSLFITRGDTLPLRLMQQLQANADPSVAAIATLIVLASLIGMLFLLPSLLKGR